MNQEPVIIPISDTQTIDLVNLHEDVKQQFFEIKRVKQNTQLNQQELIDVISLGIPDNESIEDAHKDMDNIVKNNAKEWDS